MRQLLHGPAHLCFIHSRIAFPLTNIVIATAARVERRVTIMTTVSSFLTNLFSSPRPESAAATASSTPLTEQDANRAVQQKAKKPGPHRLTYARKKRDQLLPLRDQDEGKDHGAAQAPAAADANDENDDPSQEDDVPVTFASQPPQLFVSQTTSVTETQSTVAGEALEDTIRGSENDDDDDDVAEEEEPVILSQVPYDPNDDVDVEVEDPMANDPSPAANALLSDPIVLPNQDQDSGDEPMPTVEVEGESDDHQADEENQDKQYQFTAILDHRWDGNDMQVKVAWHNSSTTWEPEANLHLDAPDALFAYWRSCGGRPVNLDDPGLFTVFAVRNHNRSRRRLLVEWTGYPREDWTWESSQAIESAATELVAAYWRKVDKEEREKPGRRRGRPRASAAVAKRTKRRRLSD